MEGFILALVYALPGPLRPIARPVADRLLRVWRWSESLFRQIRTAARSLLTGANRLRDGILSLGREALGTLQWLITIRIPALIKSARDAVVRWAVDQLNRVKTGLTSVIDTLRRWAIARVSALLSLVDSVKRWAAAQLARALAAIDRLLSRVFGLWSTPARLAAWLVAAMWSALWRFAYGNLDRIAEAVWHQRRRVFLRTIAEAERILGRIL